jgi:hypothetical protein
MAKGRKYETKLEKGTKYVKVENIVGAKTFIKEQLGAEPTTLKWSQTDKTIKGVPKEEPTSNQPQKIQFLKGKWSVVHIHKFALKNWHVITVAGLVAYGYCFGF